MRSHAAVLHGFAFALTGVGTALLGSTLPATLQHWHLPDSRGGLLLLAAWGGSTGGALLARGLVERTAAVGLLGSAVALLGMASFHPGALLWAYLLYGIGLGTTMTSISLLRSRVVPEHRAGVEMNRLNLFWAVGACCAPVLSLHSLRLLSVLTLFRAASGVFTLVALLLLAVSLLRTAGSSTPPEEPDAGASRVPTLWAPLRFCLFAGASVGLESAIGSWLTTYSERTTLAIGTAVSANAAFWVGLLLSRAAHSLASPGWLRSRAVRQGHIAAVVLGSALLVVQPTRGWLAVAGLLCGLGLGPLYPMVLAVSLPRYRSTAVFVVAGVGASLVPWLTGVLSSSLGSLRQGLIAPVIALVVLLLTAIRMRADLSPGTSAA